MSNSYSSASSRLVETVMINVEDFSENFLTCGTCLSGYDREEHTAKLLPCSHTICKTCIHRIMELQHQSMDHFRCPICRETIPYPASGGGAAAFPPAFIVNQLLDLLANQRRDLVPTCRRHPHQELLFCETCDVVFCADCRGRHHQTNHHHPDGEYEDLSDDSLSLRSMVSSSIGNCDHSDGPFGQTSLGNGETSNQILSHNVISFNVAIKRCSEILLYKAHLCVQELNSAQDAVAAELDRLEVNTDLTVNAIKSSFEKIRSLVDQREKDLLNSVQQLADDKRKALTDQLSMIQSERNLVRRKCDNIRERVDVRSISRGIAYLNDKLDTIASLTEPRENAFLRYDDYSSEAQKSPTYFNHLLKRRNTVTPVANSPSASLMPTNSSKTLLPMDEESSLKTLSNYLSKFGRIIISTTYPALCTIKLPEKNLIVNLTDKAIIFTVDYHGHLQTSSSHDPIEVYFVGPDNEKAPCRLINMADGTYQVLIRPKISGIHKLSIYILQRAMRGSPFQINVRAGQKPKWSVKKGADNVAFIQPFAVTSNQSSNGTFHSKKVNVYLLDTGNCRIVVLDHKDGSHVTSFTGDAFQRQAATGIAYLHPLELKEPSDDSEAKYWPSDEGAIVVSNWRMRAIYLLHPQTGAILHKITHHLFLEPTSVCVCPITGKILIADNAAGCIFGCQAKMESDVEFTVLSLIGNDCQLNIDSALTEDVSTEKAFEKSYSIHEKHNKYSLGFGLRRSLIKNRDQAKAFQNPFNKSASSSIKRLSMSSVVSVKSPDRSASNEKSKTLDQSQSREKLENKKSVFCNKVNGLCVSNDGSVILAAGSMIQIYSSSGKHLKDLTLPAGQVEMKEHKKTNPRPMNQTQPNRPHSTIFGSSSPFQETNRRHVSMVENHRYSQCLIPDHITSSSFTNQDQPDSHRRAERTPFRSSLSESIDESNNSLNYENTFNLSSVSDLSSQCSNRSLSELDPVRNQEAMQKPQRRPRNHSNHQHSGQFYGVSIGHCLKNDVKETIGNCLLATFTDRQRSMIVIWPESAWKVDNSIDGSSILNGADSEISLSSTTTFNSPVNSPEMKDTCILDENDTLKPFILDVDPVLRRSAGIISLEECRDLIVVDLGASSLHRLRYS